MSYLVPFQLQRDPRGLLPRLNSSTLGRLRDARMYASHRFCSTTPCAKPISKWGHPVDKTAGVRSPRTDLIVMLRAAGKVATGSAVRRAGECPRRPRCWAVPRQVGGGGRRRGVTRAGCAGCQTDRLGGGGIK